MTKLHAAGWASDSPTPAQLKEFFSQIEAGKITKNSLQAFLRDDFPVTGALTEAEQVALGILGTGKVFGYRDVARVWNVALPEIAPAIQFDEDVLRECAEDNQNGADWRLVYVNGLSLRQQEQVRGRNRKKQPCFDPDYTWWLDSDQDGWATQPVEAGYRLLDFSPRFRNTRWQAQEDVIRKLGDAFERAEEQVVSEACFSIYLIGGKKERLLSDWYHWGKLRSAGGCLVLVGAFVEFGFVVGGYWDVRYVGLLAVVLSRK